MWIYINCFLESNKNSWGLWIGGKTATAWVEIKTSCLGRNKSKDCLWKKQQRKIKSWIVLHIFSILKMFFVIYIIIYSVISSDIRLIFLNFYFLEEYSIIWGWFEMKMSQWKYSFFRISHFIFTLLCYKALKNFSN